MTRTPSKHTPLARLRLIQADHGGCDQEDCSLKQAIEDRDDVLAVWLWACSGAACSEFDELFDQHEKRIRKESA